VAHTYNPGYSGGRDQEDHGLKPARANSSQDPISYLKIIHHRKGLVECYVFLLIAYVYSSTKLEKWKEQVLPESKGGGEEREGAGGRGEKWPKQ
jgi:hypothetical protein